MYIVYILLINNSSVFEKARDPQRNAFDDAWSKFLIIRHARREILNGFNGDGKREGVIDIYL